MPARDVVRTTTQIVVYPESCHPPAKLVAGMTRLRVAEPDTLLELAVGGQVGAIAIGMGPGTLERAELVRAIKSRAPGVWCVVCGSPADEQVAMAALRAGADAYVSSADQVQPLPTKRSAILDIPRVIGEDRVTHRLLRHLNRIASTSSTVLITGETGTGKELAARYIHSNSDRRSQPFVCVNCAAVPDTLLESELFGHERGAFTGAQTSSDGKFHHANQGTLFLDEIADMSPVAQAKILRVLETREVWRLGGSRGTRVNVRIIAATNQDVERLVAEGRFRPDLYYRLNVARVTLPALRERPADIPRLIAYYVQEMNLQFGRNIAGFTEKSMKRLQSYDWPGNIRELKNLIEAAFIDLPAGRVQVAELPESVRDRLRKVANSPADEAARILAALNEMHWNVSRAAQTLQVSRMTLYRKIAKYGFSR